MEVADPVQEPAETELRPTEKLCFEAVPHHLCCTIMCYLDSQKRWHEFAQCGLRPFLRHICARLQLATKLPVEQPEDDYAVRMPVQFEARWYFHMLSTASRFCSHLASFPSALLGHAMLRVLGMMLWHS